MARRAIVIGGGISGLTAAYRLHQAGVDVTLLEASARVGGVIQTERRGDCLLEHGPDCWASTKPAAMELATELDIDDQVIGTREGVRRSFILHNGTLKRLPEGFFLISPMSIRALMRTPILSLSGKLRMALELFKRAKREDADESLASFVRRRFGREALERIAQPMVAGIYTADPEKLSLRATFPQFLEMEREHGSVIRGLRRRAKTKADDAMAKASGPRYGLFVSFKNGMATLADALQSKLPQASILLNTQVRGLARAGEGWSVQLDDETLEADDVILAVPGHVSAKLLSEVNAELAEALGQVEYAGAAVVNFIFDRAQITHSLDGMGAVIPAIEKRRIIAFSFSSVKFEGRAPEGKAIVRVFMGGALQPEIAELPTDEQAAVALAEVRELLGITGEPEAVETSSHLGAMPQYHVGHLDRVQRVKTLVDSHRGLHIIGNGFDGVGIPDCIRNANECVRAILRSTSRQAM